VLWLVVAIIWLLVVVVVLAACRLAAVGDATVVTAAPEPVAAPSLAA
jgi:hypothetical protein